MATQFQNNNSPFKLEDERPFKEKVKSFFQTLKHKVKPDVVEEKFSQWISQLQEKKKKAEAEPAPPFFTSGWFKEPTPTPIVMAMETPTPMPVAEPTPTPRPSIQEKVDEVFGDKADEFRRMMENENARYQTGKEVDIPNRIDPETGEWSADAPIAQIYNPFADSQEDSIDRGLTRINNGTFYRLLNSIKYRPMMKEAGIIDTDDITKINNKKAQEAWDKMLDPLLSIEMAKIIFQFHEDISGYGWRGWVAAPSELRGE